MPKNPETAGLSYELQYKQAGHRFIVGMDEAGRGPWAGPVVAGAVCLPLEVDDLLERMAGIHDSKQMTARNREIAVDTITEVALAWGVGSASAKVIDEMGIIPALKLAMTRALKQLVENAPFDAPDVLLLDYLRWDEMTHIPTESIKHGDSVSLSIAAASVLAKVWRDDYMRELDNMYPEYGFGSHKGYGTAYHRASLLKLGATPEHRMCYKPVWQIDRYRSLMMQ